MVSVIVPVYNAEAYLPAAIDSISSQTYKDWELLLIDDGSTDRSGIICDEAAASCPDRIKVFHKKNQGVAIARNVGVDNARGDFIMFLDADDLLPNNAILTLVNLIEKGNAQIAVGKFMKFYKDFPAHKTDKKDKIEIFSGCEALEYILYQTKMDNSLWGKIFRKELFEDIRCIPGIIYEDLEITPKIFLRAKRVISTDEIVYHYRQHEASYLHNFSLRRADMLTATRMIEEAMVSESAGLIKASRSRRLSAAFNMLLLLAANKDKITIGDKEEADRLAEESRNIIKRLRLEILFNRKVRAKNKFGILGTYVLGFPTFEKIFKRFYC